MTGGELLSMLATEKRKMGLVSELPAVYLHTRSSASRDSPPEIRRTCSSPGVRGDFRFRRQEMMKYPYFTVPGVC